LPQKQIGFKKTYREVKQMTVKELCLKLVELREQGKIEDNTTVCYAVFDSNDDLDYWELITDIELQKANVSPTPELTKIETIICLS
jgi:hypothetical protein